MLLQWNGRDLVLTAKRFGQSTPVPVRAHKSDIIKMVPLWKKTANRIQSGNLGASVYTQIACTIDGGSWAKGGYMYAVPIQPAAGGNDLGGATFSVAYLYHLYPLKPDVDGSSIGSTVNGSFAGGRPFQAAFERVTENQRSHSLRWNHGARLRLWEGKCIVMNL